MASAPVLRRTGKCAWYSGLENPQAYLASSKQDDLDRHYSVTAIIACYKDAQAIPIMYRRLTDTFPKAGVDYMKSFLSMIVALMIRKK